MKKNISFYFIGFFVGATALFAMESEYSEDSSIPENSDPISMPVIEDPIVNPLPQDPVSEDPVVKPLPEDPVYEDPIVKPLPEDPVAEDPIVKPLPEDPVYQDPIVKPLPPCQEPIDLPYMTAKLIDAYVRELREFENAIAIQKVFLNAVHLFDATINKNIPYSMDPMRSDSRGILKSLQSKMELVFKIYENMKMEVDPGLRDNCYRNLGYEEINVLSNSLANSNAKMALIMEKQLAFLLESGKNTLLASGCLTAWHTGAVLADKIFDFDNSIPDRRYASKDLSQDVILHSIKVVNSQLWLMHKLNTVYLTAAIQAYSIARDNMMYFNMPIPQDLPAEQIYNMCFQDIYEQEMSFEKMYKKLEELLRTNQIIPICDYRR